MVAPPLLQKPHPQSTEMDNQLTLALCSNKNVKKFYFSQKNFYPETCGDENTGCPGDDTKLPLVAGDGRGKSLERNDGGAPYSTEVTLEHHRYKI